MITVVGSLNMDLAIETPKLPAPGETVLGRGYRQSPGGKGANQACALGRLGLPVQMIGCVGDDAFGRAMTGNLSAYGVASNGLVTKPHVASGVAFIMVDDHGENQIVVSAGANETLSAEDVEKHSALIKSSRAVIAQLETPIAAVEAALRIGRAAGAITILNPAPARPVSDALLNLCDWLIPNEAEAAQLLAPLDPRHDPKELSASLRQRCSQTGVVITLGAAGAWLDHAAEKTLVPSFKVEAVDTVGAGDAFVGAFVARLVEGAKPREAVEFAVAAAALAVTKLGAQAGLPNRSEVEAVQGRAGPLGRPRGV